MMKISELITKLEKIKSEEGDINVCVSQSHEYWGSVERYIDEYRINVSDHAQPKGPKSGESERCVVFSYDY